MRSVDKPLTEAETIDDALSRSMIEKKSVINLLEAYAVSTKHYLRGEDGIYYKYVESPCASVGPPC
jgi:putative membrane protein